MTLATIGIVGFGHVESGQFKLETFNDRAGAGADVVGWSGAGPRNGALLLTADGQLNKAAALKLPDLDPGNRIESFTARFDLAMFSRRNRMGGGLMFTFGTIPINGVPTDRAGFSANKSVSVNFHTSWDGDDPPAIKVLVSGRVVASVPTAFPNLETKPQPVEIHWDDNGIDVTYRGVAIHEDGGVEGFQAKPDDRFAFSAATRSSISQTTTLGNLAVSTNLFRPIKTNRVMLSEILPIPHAGLKDEQHEVSEWIELYNGTAKPANLEGWTLRSGKRTWKLPSYSLEPYSYGVVFSSGKNRNRAGDVLHTNFSLPDKGGEVALFDSACNVQSQFSYGAASPDVSYGWAHAPEKLGFFEKSTPGTKNKGEPSPHSEAPPVHISHKGGIMREPVTVSLKSDTVPENGVIRYALGGSSPKPDSPAYENPIVVSQTTTIRAAVFAPDYLPGPVAQSAFVFLHPEVQKFSSNLPIIVAESAGAHIDSDYLPWVKRKYRAVHTSLFDKDGDRAALSNKPDYSGFGAFRVRGHSSATNFPKKQYAWEVRDDRGEDLDVSLLGMPPEADWILAAPYSDKSMMRNVLAFGLGRSLFRSWSAPRTQYVELFLNQNGDDVTMADYQGVYVLTEKLKAGPSRIKVEPLNPLITDPELIQGGYVFKIDKGMDWDETFRTNIHNMAVAFVEPDDPNDVQKAYLKDYLDRFERTMASDDFNDPQKGYEAFIDVDNFIRAMWMVELFREIDGWWISTYFSKERNGKIRATPLWDFNLSLGNADYVDGYQPTGWHRDAHASGGHPWFHRLMDDPRFEQRYWETYFDLRDSLFSEDHLMGEIDTYANALSESAARNFTRWPILGRYVWPNAPGVQGRRTFDSEIDWMKDWLRARLRWIDQQYVAPPELTHSGGKVTMKLPEGVTGQIYYTTDGSDPGFRGRIPWKAFMTSSTIPAEVLIPTPANGGHGLNTADWTKTDAPKNAAQWAKALRGAIGFEREPADYEDYILHHVPEMANQFTSCYIRIPFELDDLAAINRLDQVALRMRYDDGFVVYLNGVKIADKNAPEEVAWDASATRTTDDNQAVRWANFDITAFREHFRKGENMLAIHGLNESKTSSDALWIASLAGVDPEALGPSKKAIHYKGPFPLGENQDIRAAVFNGRTWGASTRLD